MTRPDIYRVLRELDVLGLVERTVARPVEFRATPLEQGISVLFEKRLEEMSELRSNTERLIKKFTESRAVTIAKPENFKFVEIPRRGSLLAQILDERKTKN